MGDTQPHLSKSFLSHNSGVRAHFVPATVHQDSPVSFGTATLSEGIVRLFRENITTESPSSVAQCDGTILAVLAVPTYMTPADFLTYVAPAEEGLAHIRLIRDALENRSIVLMKFRHRDYAEEFAQVYNGREFNSIEPESCHVVRITSISVEAKDVAIGGLLQTPSQRTTDVHELPTCPVCLERMDSTVTGLVTVPCSHTFHCQCLSKWGDSRCPVCRYSQALLTSHRRASSSSRPTNFPSSGTDDYSQSVSKCSACGSTTNLWICLICGNVGCGRYGKAHAHTHYRTTMHLYALELETQRVWDYAGDGYVHRLIQNRADGKLVELPSASALAPSFTQSSSSQFDSNTSTSTTTNPNLGPTASDALAAEKVEAIGLEYSYLLTSQLDSQRAYYEEQISTLRAELSSAHEKISFLESSSPDSASLQLLEERAAKAEAKIQKGLVISRRFEKDLKEERLVSEGLMTTIAALRGKLDEGEKAREQMRAEMDDMKDQLRDVMFYMQARDKIESSASKAGRAEEADGQGKNAIDELLADAAGGSIITSGTSPPVPSASSSLRKKGKKKR